MAKRLKPLLRRVEEILRTRYPDLLSGLIYGDLNNNRVLGYVVSAKFRGQDHSLRQQRLKGILESSLSQEELSRVGPIATLTPAEADIGDAAA